MDDATIDALRALAGDFPELHLLLLVGSRARGTAHDRSDVDLAHLADSDFDVGRFLGEATIVLGTDRVDLADLSTANALFRFEAADTGRLLVGDRATFDAFREEAVHFWCDAGPLIRQAHDDVLERLG